MQTLIPGSPRFAGRSASINDQRVDPARPQARGDREPGRAGTHHEHVGVRSLAPRSALDPRGGIPAPSPRGTVGGRTARDTRPPAPRWSRGARRRRSPARAVTRPRATRAVPERRCAASRAVRRRRGAVRHRRARTRPRRSAEARPAALPRRAGIRRCDRAPARAVRRGGPRSGASIHAMPLAACTRLSNPRRSPVAPAEPHAVSRATTTPGCRAASSAGLSPSRSRARAR